MKLKPIFVLTFLMVLCFQSVLSELFTSLATLTNGLYKEKELAVELRKYVRAEQNRLDEVLKLADEYDNHASEALVNPESYLANPINAYLFVKRFTTEMDETKSLLSSETNAKAFLDEVEYRRSSLPTDEDLEGIVQALTRLQDTYELPAHKIADGTFTPINRSPRLSASDCYEIGRMSYGMRDYYHCVIWMRQALDMLLEERNATVDKFYVLDYLSYSASNQGNMRYARKLTQDMLDLNPTHSRALNNMKYFESQIADENEAMIAKGEKPLNDDYIPPLKNERSIDEYRRSDEFKRYEALCRGEDVMPNPYLHTLKCYYTNVNRNPLLVLAPVKVEEFYKDPDLFLYHDVVSDNEIEIIKRLATPELKRAVVNDPATGKLVTATYRISRSAWLTDEVHTTVETATNRISAITGLDMSTVELLQVVNYGIGGQYEPHFDHSRDNAVERNSFSEFEGNRIATWIYYMDDRHHFDSWRGNRIATWMFYLSDVDAGGYTVFTSIGAKVPPVKGAAAFWWNLRRNGRGDERTRHAGCPVLAGSKWVANKWMHERGQEFKRPCALDPRL